MSTLIFEILYFRIMAPQKALSNNHQQKRVKVRLQFPEKIFYERVLTEWKDNITDSKNYSYVIRKALNNIKLFPLNVHGYSELRKIHGIGEDIATKLDAAWKHACLVYFDNQNPDIKQIKELARGESFRILTEATSLSGGDGHKRVPFVPNQKITKDKKEKPAIDKGLEKKQQKKCIKETIENEQLGHPDLDLIHPAEVGATSSNRSNSQEFIVPNDQMDYNNYSHQQSTKKTHFPDAAGTSKSMATIEENNYLHQHAVHSSSLDSNNQTNGQKQMKMLVYTPGETIGDAHLLLIADNRESIGANGKKQRKGGKGVVEHLQTFGVQCQSRILSVGDYLWILQWVDWEGKQQELVLDYIVERKTWDDLKRSIRETRYLEQKSRLRRCGLKNVIMLIEGGINADRSLEQAMASTSVENGFLVHRTMNMQGTAKFLQHLTKRLDERCKKEEVRGYSFEQFQENHKKQKPKTVSECWLRQLTVCPGMSMDRAQLIRRKFPSFRALIQLYKEKEGGNMEENKGLLAKELPLMPMSISKHIHLFVQKARET